MNSRRSFQPQWFSDRELMRNRKLLKINVLIWTCSREARSGLWRKKICPSLHVEAGEERDKDRNWGTTGTGLHKSPVTSFKILQDRRVEPRNKANSLWPQPPPKLTGTAWATRILQAFNAFGPLTLMAKASSTEPLRTLCRTCHCLFKHKKSILARPGPFLTGHQILFPSSVKILPHPWPPRGQLLAFKM